MEERDAAEKHTIPNILFPRKETETIPSEKEISILDVEYGSMSGLVRDDIAVHT